MFAFFLPSGCWNGGCGNRRLSCLYMLVVCSVRACMPRGFVCEIIYCHFGSSCVIYEKLEFGRNKSSRYEVCKCMPSVNQEYAVLNNALEKLADHTC